MKRNLILLLLSGITLISVAEAAEWKRVIPVSGSGEKQVLILKGKTRTYYKANNLRFNVTGPGALKVISRWVGTRPEARDTTYSLRVNVGRKHHKKTYEITRSGIAGAPGKRGTWVGKSRTLIVPLPPVTTTIAMSSPNPEVCVSAFYSEKPLRLGNLRSMSPQAYSEVVRLERKEREVKYYRATVSEPVKLEIIGPSTLVVYARLEFTYDMKGIQNLGIHVLEDESVLHSFAWSTRRSDVTRYIDRDDLIPSPGQKAVLRVGKGIHRICFRPSSGMKNVLFRFLLPEQDLFREG